MAGIDKTYTNSYKEYKEFKEWANKQYITFYDGYKVCIGDSLYDYWEEEDFTGKELPIMNTAIWIDIYLIQNCPYKFVLDRMKEVYGEDHYKELKLMDLTNKPPKDYQQNRKIKIKRFDGSFPLHNQPYKTNVKRNKWWLQNITSSWFYNTETKTWSNYNNAYPFDTTAASMSSIKAIVRHLRKQYLPKGIVFTISGNYVGEEYEVTIK